jgi:beta-mannosidase
MKTAQGWCGLVLAAVVWLGGAAATAAGLLKVDLGGAWQVTMEGATNALPATVPGCIHTDLLAAKQIPDPFWRDNEATVQWISDKSWTYRRSVFAAPALLRRERVLLRCEGLDTLATVTLNGTELGRTDNMFRTWEFDVKKLLKSGSNALEIRFDPVLPVIRAKEKERKLPTWAYPGAAYVRKEPCNFGWDWGPTLITCGIWKNIGLVAFDTARLDGVLILQDHKQSGTVGLEVQVTAEAGAGAALAAQVQVVDPRGAILANEKVALAAGKGSAKIAVGKPQLWWPAGMGAQPLYTVKTTLLDARGGTLDSATKRIGLRTLQAVQQTKDTTMHFVANGVPFFAKGGNWIPADQFATRMTKARLQRYMEDAVAANMNSLRFWGGGYYEEDELFDLCDELGLCVWLDFKFSCTTYPAFDAAFLANVAAEARDNLKRLRHHPSIAVWCGNNEIMYFRDKQWTDKKMGEDDYYKLFRDTLGNQARELAPQTDYVTGSPDCGDVHFWEVWHGGKPFEVYRNIHGFVSEFGFQSFPEPKTVATFSEPADRTSVYSRIMMWRMRSNRMYMDVKEDGKIGTDKIMKLVKQYFRDPKDFESTLWLSQITQGYGIKYGAEGWRREMPKSMGCVYWQYNDTWPCSSWSSLDYFGRWKALHYMAKKFYAPVLVSGAEDMQAGTVELFVTSDRMEDCQGKLTWTVTDVAGQTLKQGTLAVAVAAHKSQKVETLKLAAEIQQHGKNNVLVWLKLEVGGVTVSDNLVTFVYPREFKLAEPKLAAAVAEDKGAFTVTLTAEQPALWTWLELDGVDARCSGNFVHVTKGTPVVITVQPAKPLAKAEFQKALRVRSLFDTYAH